MLPDYLGTHVTYGNQVKFETVIVFVVTFCKKRLYGHHRLAQTERGSYEKKCLFHIVFVSCCYEDM